MLVCVRGAVGCAHTSWSPSLWGDLPKASIAPERMPEAEALGMLGLAGLMRCVGYMCLPAASGVYPFWDKKFGETFGWSLWPEMETGVQGGWARLMLSLATAAAASAPPSLLHRSLCGAAAAVAIVCMQHAFSAMHHAPCNLRPPLPLPCTGKAGSAQGQCAALVSQAAALRASHVSSHAAKPAIRVGPRLVALTLRACAPPSPALRACMQATSSRR